MAKFFYTAREKGGILVRGSVDAADFWIARKQLVKSGLTPISIDRWNFSALFTELKTRLKSFFASVSLEEKLVLIGQLEAGSSVGIPLFQVLQMIEADTANPTLRQALQEILADLSQGSNIHQAFAKQTSLFTPSIIGLIKAGEASGELDRALSRIGGMLEQQSENVAKMKSATFYPKIVIFVMAFVVSGVVYFIIPKIKEVLFSMGKALPPITVFVVGTADFILKFWPLLIIAAFGMRAAFRSYISTNQGRLRWDRLKLKIPVFGQLFLFLELNNFCVVLDVLIGSGVPLMDALETLKSSQQNVVFIQDISECQAEIGRGGTFSGGLIKSVYFPSSYRSMLAIAEETGRMEPILQRLGKQSQVQVDYRLDNLSKLIEPILLVIIFIFVTVLALAIFLPIWKMSGGKS